jgi:DNA-directed RNA polymerase specialized sigma24 family protein
MSNARGSVAFDPSGCAAPAFAPQAREVSVADEIDEAAELRSALSGDERAFTALYRRHQAAVYRFAWLLTGSAAQAADITQDVFVEMLTTASGYDATRGSLAAYLCGIARFRTYRAIDMRMQNVEDFDALVEAHPSATLPRCRTIDYREPARCRRYTRRSASCRRSSVTC